MSYDGGGNYSSNNDYSGIGSTFSAVSNAIDFTNTVESTTTAINNYSSNTQSDNHYPGNIGWNVAILGSVVESVNNVESTRSAFDDHDYPSTRLQIDNVPATVRSSSSHYPHRTRHTTIRTRNTRSSAANSCNCSEITGFIIFITVILLVVFFSGLIIRLRSHRSSEYKA